MRVTVGESQIGSAIVAAGQAIRPGGGLAVVGVLLGRHLEFAGHSGIQKKNGQSRILNAAKICALKGVG